MATAQLVKQAVTDIPKGKPFATAQLLMYGSRASVDQTLSRLVRAGTVRRLARGLYVRPKQSRLLGSVTPSVREVAAALAEPEGAKVLPHGAEAARHLGLTTQVPMEPVFITSGRSRNLRIGRLRLRLKHASPRKLALAGRPAGEAIAALHYLGRLEVTAETIEKIRARIGAEEFAALKAAAPVIPGWMTKVIREAERRHRD